MRPDTPTPKQPSPSDQIAQNVLLAKNYYENTAQAMFNGETYLERKNSEFYENIVRRALVYFLGDAQYQQLPKDLISVCLRDDKFAAFIKAFCECMYHEKRSFFFIELEREESKAKVISGQTSAQDVAKWSLCRYVLEPKNTPVSMQAIRAFDYVESLQKALVVANQRDQAFLNKMDHFFLNNEENNLFMDCLLKTVHTQVPLDKFFNLPVSPNTISLMGIFAVLLELNRTYGNLIAQLALIDVRRRSTMESKIENAYYPLVDEAMLPISLVYSFNNPERIESDAEMLARYKNIFHDWIEKCKCFIAEYRHSTGQLVAQSNVRVMDFYEKNASIAVDDADADDCRDTPPPVKKWPSDSMPVPSYLQQGNQSPITPALLTETPPPPRHVDLVQDLGCDEELPLFVLEEADDVADRKTPDFEENDTEKHPEAWHPRFFSLAESDENVQENPWGEVKTPCSR